VIIMRVALRSRFPSGEFPRLWCPILTHFRAAREIDQDRIDAHLASISPYVKGILVPGSTGEGWQMSDAETEPLLEVCLRAAERLGMRVLIGVLKTTTEETIAAIHAIERWRDHPAVVGITVCPPTGRDLTQEDLHRRLAEILGQGWPTALYQLPQVTQNEMSPSLVAALAAEFPNAVLFKDSSGSDRVASSGQDFGGVLCLRGAEQGGYASWLRDAGGIYDGFLLSTANVFAPQLCEMMRLIDAGSITEAESLSATLTSVVSGMFAIVDGFPLGNAFTNANKVVDHCLAYGAEATAVVMPMLYCGQRLPADFVRQAVQLLGDHSMMHRRGYLA
jgi:dihydrodipicolinate synthase/N-acetylneuraminate lyase